MCNKQNYSFKKIYIITFIITVVSFIVFFSYAIFHGSVIKDIIVNMQDKDSIIRDYFKDNGTGISESMFSLIINIYKFIFLTLFIILVLIFL